MAKHKYASWHIWPIWTILGVVHCWCTRSVYSFKATGPTLPEINLSQGGYGPIFLPTVSWVSVAKPGYLRIHLESYTSGLLESVTIVLSGSLIHSDRHALLYYNNHL